MREILNTGEDERTGVAYGARAGTGTEERAAEVVTCSLLFDRFNYCMAMGRC